MFAYRKETFDKPYSGVAGRVYRFARVKHFIGWIQKESSKYVGHPWKAVDQHHAEPDKYASKKQSPEDAPKQYPVLKAGRHFEISKDERYDKNIVHTQRLLNEIPGQVFERSLRAAERAFNPVEFIGIVNKYTEQYGNKHPQGSPAQGFFGANHMRMSIKHTQIKRKQKKDQHQETDPKNRYVHLV